MRSMSVNLPSTFLMTRISPAMTAIPLVVNVYQNECYAEKMGLSTLRNFCSMRSRGQQPFRAQPTKNAVTKDVIFRSQL